jgi:glycine cleavage system H protein
VTFLIQALISFQVTLLYEKICQILVTTLPAMKFPENLFYTDEHLWVLQEPHGYWLAGITDYAQDLLGDIVFIEPPQIDSHIINGKPCGIVESVKTGSDLHAPMNGVVTEINEDLLNAPEGINDKPYAAWIFKFKPDDANETKHFLSAEAYKALINDD